MIACELMQLPAPKIEVYEDSTKVILYSKISFTYEVYSDMGLI